MNRLIVILILIINCSPFKIWACSCIGERTVKEEIHESDMVLTGIVLSKNIFTINESVLPKGLNLKKVEFVILITRLYKGKMVGDTVRVISGIGGGDCGYEFRLGMEYIIYSTYSEKYFESGEKVKGFYQTDICNRTRLIDKRELRKIKKYCSTRKM